MRLIVFSVIAVYLLIGTSLASTPLTTKVTSVGSYGDGSIFVALRDAVDEPGCSTARFDLSNTSTSKKIVLATAMMVVSTNADVTVRTSGCFNGFATLNNSRSSYFYIKN